MARGMLVLAALVLAAGAAAAQPPPGGFRIIDAKADKGRLVWIETEHVPVAKKVQVEVERDGKKVLVEQTVTALEAVAVRRECELKDVRATDAGGRAIPTDRLAKLLKDETPVVLSAGPLSDKHRALFKDRTTFVELPAAAPAPK